MKERAGGPVDDAEDIEAGVWGGHIPLRRVALPPVSSPDSHTDVPAGRGGARGRALDA